MKEKLHIYATLALRSEMQAIMIGDDVLVAAVFGILQSEKIKTVRVNALKIIGSLMTHDKGDVVARKIKLMPIMAMANDNETVKIICWVLSNYVACGSEFVDTILNDNLHIQVSHWADHANENVRIESLWILCNMISQANDLQMAKLL